MNARCTCRQLEIAPPITDTNETAIILALADVAGWVEKGFFSPLSRTERAATKCRKRAA